MANRIKVYIQDSNSEYVDFTNRVDLDVKDRLVSLGTVSHSTEKKAFASSFESSMSQLVMDNTDGFWDNPDAWDSLTTVNNNTAVFDKSENQGEVLLWNQKCKIKIESLQKDGTVKEDTVGIFFISNLLTNSNSGLATITLVSLSQPLRKLSADKVRRGKNWYENRDIVYLMKELLKSKYADTENTLPISFSFPNSLIISTFEGNRVLSSYGKPPERVIGTKYVEVVYYSFSDAFSTNYKGRKLEEVI